MGDSQHRLRDKDTRHRVLPGVRTTAEFRNKQERQPLVVRIRFDGVLIKLQGVFK